MPTGSASSGTNWGISSETYTPYAQADIMSALHRGEAVSNLPFQPYLGQMVAGFSPTQIAAMQGVYGIQGYAEPYIQGAGGLLQQAQQYADPNNPRLQKIMDTQLPTFSQQAVQQYYSPYQQNVIKIGRAHV